MTEQTHKPCPYKSCGSSDAFAWNEEGYGYCHSCGESYPSKKKLLVFDWVKSEYSLPDKTTRSDRVKTIVKATSRNVRGLEQDVAKLYDIQNHLDEDGEVVRTAIKWPDGNIQYRYYDDEKAKYIFKDKGKEVLDLFGPSFNTGSSKRLYITEGAIDAASLYQALGKTFPVKGLKASSINKKYLEHNHDELSLYSEIVYAGELDKAGRKCADLLYQTYPEKMYYVPLNRFKDANEFLTNDAVDDLMWSARRPQRYTPENFFMGSSDRERILREENPYKSYPVGHSGLDSMSRGLVKGGVTFLKAMRGTGKTELFRYLQQGVLQNNDDIKIGLIHMEEAKATTYRCMATYELGVNVRTEQDQEENGKTIAEIVSAADKFCQSEDGVERVLLFELLPTDEPISIVEYCRLAASVYDCDFIFIDHIQRLIYRSGAVDGTGQLTQVGTMLAELAKELDIGIIAISHINKDGDTQYAKALENEAIICMNLERDLEEEDEIIKNTTTFVIDKNRPFAKLGEAGKVYFNPTTTILEEAS